MIAYLKGTLEYRNDPYLIIDVHGVGYKVFASHGVLNQSQSIGSQIKLFTYTHVREDLLELYGFADLHDLYLFEQLLSISGIGPKTAIGVFSLGSSNEIAQAIIEGNVNFFSGVPRLGKKNAQKIIIELKNKLGSHSDLDLSETEMTDNADLISALKVFGFSQAEAIEAARNVNGKPASLEEKVKMALKYLGK